MTLIASTNQYLGINAHFQSYAQNTRDGWSSFHFAHATHLADTIARLLPPGYEVAPEASLQIRLYDPDTGEIIKSFPEPVDPEYRFTAVVIYELRREGDPVPITRFELLSPTNKTNRQRREQYLAKRAATLQSGTSLVEIDYLHQSRTLIPDMPDYAKKETGAYPYTITVTHPIPTLEQGRSYIYGFCVDEPMPPIKIPLAGEDSISLDFCAVYNHTFSIYSYYYKRADYTREPLAFDRYLKEDQLRIWQRMIAVIEAERAGKDLSDAPFTADVPALA